MDIIEPVLVSEANVQSILDAFYGVSESFVKIVNSINVEKISEKAVKGLKEVTEEVPIIKIVDMIFGQAIRDRASDIHVEPEEETLRIRNRIDGILYEVTILPKKLQSGIVSRIKILANMDIAENRKPQDGRIQLVIQDHDLDMRVSSFPTIYGENLVLRILDKSIVLMGLKEAGFLDKNIEVYEKLIHKPHGIIFVTGPTGSGKTSTLYTTLSIISTIEKNIITIEDPVEYELPLIRQTQINPKAGITFANGLRSMLRQDPDIIMVGEIRDKETADVAIQAALTGHLVLSTLHTNDAATTLTRLSDMGIEPFLISSATIGIVAQRLIRLICNKCRESYVPASRILKELNIIKGTKFYRGKGCTACKGSGFMGRKGIFEILQIDEKIKRLIDMKSSSEQIRKEAVNAGMKTLRQDGLDKVKKGLTAIEEVLRVTEIE